MFKLFHEASRTNIVENPIQYNGKFVSLSRDSIPMTSMEATKSYKTQWEQQKVDDGRLRSIANTLLCSWHAGGFVARINENASIVSIFHMTRRHFVR